MIIEHTTSIIQALKVFSVISAARVGSELSNGDREQGQVFGNIFRSALLKIFNGRLFCVLGMLPDEVEEGLGLFSFQASALAGACNGKPFCALGMLIDGEEVGFRGRRAGSQMRRSGILRDGRVSESWLPVAFHLQLMLRFSSPTSALFRK